MELRHRLLVFDHDPKFHILKVELDRLGCIYKTKDHVIEINFSDNVHYSKELIRFARKNKFWLVTYLYYEEAEIHNSEWVQVSVGEFQYPQPENPVVNTNASQSNPESYKEFTYDLRDYCGRCGIGARQTNPFRLKRDFKQKTCLPRVALGI